MTKKQAIRKSTWPSSSFTTLLAFQLSMHESFKSIGNNHNDSGVWHEEIIYIEIK